MRFELFVALRYLITRRTSLISTIGVGVGVMALIIALALMTGLQGELRDRLLGSTAHVYVFVTGGVADYQAEVEKLRAVEGVIGAGPALLGKALVVTDRSDEFITVKGVDPALEGTVTDISQSMIEGSLGALADGSEDRLPGILIGRELARKLGVKAGDSVRLISPSGTLTPHGMINAPRRAEVAGIYSLGLLEFDSGYGVVSLGFAKRLLGRDAADLIELRVDDIYEAPAIAARITTRYGTKYVAQDWVDMNAALFSALWLEKIAISITVGLIVVVAALNIVASLILLVMEKRRDIAILKTMGTSSGRVMRIFMLQGLVIGSIGTVLGSAGGLGISWVVDRYQLIQIPMDVYQVSHIPFVVLPRDFAVVVVLAIVVCFVATIYPSRQASKLRPVEALRFE